MPNALTNLLGRGDDKRGVGTQRLKHGGCNKHNHDSVWHVIISATMYHKVSETPQASIAKDGFNLI